MYDTAGMMLRETWKRSGKTGCKHTEFTEERSCSGVGTGAYICTTCGHRLVSQDPGAPTKPEKQVHRQV